MYTKPHSSKKGDTMTDTNMRFMEYISKTGNDISTTAKRLELLRHRQWHAEALRKDYEELMQIPDTQLSLTNGTGVIATSGLEGEYELRRLESEGKTLDAEMTGRLQGTLAYIYEQETTLEKRLMQSAKKAVAAEGRDAYWMPNREPHLRRLKAEEGFPLDYRQKLRELETEFNTRRMTEQTYQLLMTASVEQIYEYVRGR